MSTANKCAEQGNNSNESTCNFVRFFRFSSKIHVLCVGPIARIPFTFVLFYKAISVTTVTNDTIIVFRRGSSSKTFFVSLRALACSFNKQQTYYIYFKKEKMYKQGKAQETKESRTNKATTKRSNAPRTYIQKTSKKLGHILNYASHHIVVYSAGQ